MRRSMTLGLAAFAAVAALALPAATRADDKPAVASDLYSIPVKNLDGSQGDLGQYKGKVTLVVNVASECGLTPQYSGLQELHEKYKDRGFSVLGFPCNDFGGQEPGTPAEIKSFCESNYHVTFPMFEKVVSKEGPGQSPVYAYLESATNELPGWNFAKYLVGKDGKAIRFFGSRTAPNDKALLEAIEAALGPTK